MKYEEHLNKRIESLQKKADHYQSIQKQLRSVRSWKQLHKIFGFAETKRILAHYNSGRLHHIQYEKKDYLIKRAYLLKIAPHE